MFLAAGVPDRGYVTPNARSSHYAAIWTQVFQRFEYGGNHTRILAVFGADDRFMEILGGGMVLGRSFTAAEEGFGPPPVVVVTQAFAKKYFPAARNSGT